MDSARILVVDDEANIRQTLTMTLEADGHRVDEAASGDEALGRLARGGVDLVLLDIRMPGKDGLQVLGELGERQLDVPVIIMSGHATIEAAVQATRLGALDFLEKPLSAERVGVAVTGALERGRLERENRALREQVTDELDLIGESPAMQELRAHIEKIAPTDGRVLVLGESGTGKELVARAIHDHSPRSREPFVVVNCAAVPGELIESELFGHEKGAFTGAQSRRRGRFEHADHGTLFLDEIGDMPLAMQPKLLRVLEDGRVERVGGNEQLQVDVRVVAATNQDLEARVTEGRFRADLYHRLNVLPIRLVPLRERRGDLPLLTAHFLALISRRHGKPALGMSADAQAMLEAYPWPGNVRELRNAVERLVILADGPEIVGPQVRAILPHLARAASEAGIATPHDLKEAVRDFERRHIERVVMEAGGVMTEAARLLGLERSYLYKKMRDLGIERSKS